MYDPFPGVVEHSKTCIYQRGNVSHSRAVHKRAPNLTVAILREGTWWVGVVLEMAACTQATTRAELIVRLQNLVIWNLAHGDMAIERMNIMQSYVRENGAYWHISRLFTGRNYTGVDRKIPKRFATFHKHFGGYRPGVY